MNSYIDAFKKYADFSGRTRRRDYWTFLATHIIVWFALCALCELPTDVGAILLLIYLFASIIPCVAIATRRLHDTNRSGWYQLINAIPLGAFVLIYFLCEDSQADANEYGPNPKKNVA